MSRLRRENQDLAIAKPVSPLPLSYASTYAVRKNITTVQLEQRPYTSIVT